MSGRNVQVPEWLAKGTSNLLNNEGGTMRRRRLVLGASLMVAMLIAALATACGGDDATSTPIPTATPTTAPTSTPTMVPTATPVPPSAVADTQMEDKMGALTEGSVLIALNPQNDSGQSGWATLTAR